MKEIVIFVAQQTLEIKENGSVLKTYTVSTAKNGVGEKENTGCTPRGQHVVSEKFGTNLPLNTVFVARQPTGEVYTTQLGKENPERDWVLSRILWLSGCEEGKNKGSLASGEVCDSHARYIYIHGTPDTEPMGKPLSHGCVRMRNSDVMELYDLVEVGTPVFIHAE